MARIKKCWEEETLDGIYDCITLECKKRKLSQAQIGQELGLTQQDVSDIFRKKRLSLEQFVYLMGLFGKEIKCTEKE